jgi:lipopolysaccharide biosynthesis glycosyltransferase
MQKDRLIPHPPLFPLVKPAFAKNNIPVVFATDSNYLPYLGVALHSLIKNSSSKNNYDICILRDVETEVSDFPLEFYQRQNVSVRFVAVNLTESKINFADHLISYFSHEVYFRFFIPKIFANYKKVMYLDVDILVLADVAELYRIEMKGKALAAVSGLARLFNLVDYIRQTLKMKRADNYFCSGIMLFNIDVLRKDDFMGDCLRKLKEMGRPKAVDQDVMSVLYEGRVLYLPLEWSVYWSLLRKTTIAHLQIMERFPKEHAAYVKVLSRAKIIHYTGDDKPWSSPDEKLARPWWYCARETPYYEQIIYENAFKCHKPLYESWLALLESEYWWLLWKNIILSKIVLGKRRRHYHENVWWLRKLREARENYF